MTHDPRWLRRVSRLLSGLIQTDEDQLSAFVRERVPNDEVNEEHAAEARTTLILIGEALLEPNPARAMSLGQARRALEQGQEADPTPSSAAASPSASTPASPARPSPAHPNPAHPGPAAPPAPPTPAPLPAAVIKPKIDVGGASPWAPDKGPDALALTVDGAAPSSGRMPFKKDASRKPPKKISLEPNPQMGQTAPVKPRTPAAALPFAGEPKITLEQYAYFCVERERWPHYREATLTKYGLVEADEEPLHEHYRSAMDRQPALAKRFTDVRKQAEAQLDDPGG